MSWKNVRLELARTQDFPNGSVGRAYLLRLPLDDSGLIDEGQVISQPQRATVRRHWPNEPDRNGYLVPSPGGWAFSYAADGSLIDGPCNLEAHPLRVGDCVTIIEADGARLPFRVTYCN